ncbi:MAG: electron transfer flavoprotein subunit alpha/FixB family protein [Candidatus Marinimicrobia bacterium]|nr:electron transfer flavoprotein subunit alpha/FixB family protein [Candidatus Neomarinimicrobiota bacterium]
MNKLSHEVWVYIEKKNDNIADVSLELLSKGRKLAEKLNGTLKAVIIGDNLEELAKQTFHYGADEALVVEHADLKEYLTMPYSRILSELVKERQPRIVLFGATFVGRDIAPRVASNTLSGLTADCTDLQISDVTYMKKEYPKLLLQIRPAFGGNIVATIITPDNPVQMASVREGVMEMSALDKPLEGKIAKIPYVGEEIDKIIEIIDRHQEECKVNLKCAPIIVAGGYGMGSKENFGLLKKLADLIGGEVAGSRAAVDAGFIEHERQVGQTGVTVRPKLYIAAGISGAIQHRAGMDESSKIIAINSDPDAPIFGVCHYKILGDAIKIIPALIEAYKNKLK